jgi:hypothetical protein
MKTTLAMKPLQMNISMLRRAFRVMGHLGLSSKWV